MWEYFCTTSLGEYEMRRDWHEGVLGSGGMCEVVFGCGPLPGCWSTLPAAVTQILMLF